LVTLVALPLVLNIDRLMDLIAVDPAVVPIGSAYLSAVAWGVPGVCLYLVLRYVGDGVGFTRPMMYVQAAGLLLNVGVNYVLMFGKLGFPAMGAVGCGWATALVLWFNTGLMMLYALRHPRFRELRLHDRIDRPDRPTIRKLILLGVPMALTIVMETGLFAAVSLLMGRIGALAVAAHQIAINYASLMFMVPLGLGMAITVRVGQAAGAGSRTDVRRAGFVGMIMSVALMIVSAIVMLLIPKQIVRLYTDQAELLGLAAQLLFAAALFQVSDGLQVSALGALRGLKDVTAPMLITFVSYWMIGLPLGYFLGFGKSQGPLGLWAGLIAGLTVAAILLSLRFHRFTSTRSRSADAPP
jgi:MATE family multidrug resistance protein